MRRRLAGTCLVLLLALVGWQPADAYIGGPPASLGMMCWWSTHVAIVQVEKIDREKGILIFRKLRDVKGKWPTETMKQNIGTAPGDRQYILQWAEVGKTTVMCALESYKWSHTYIDKMWYACNTPDWQWWTMSHVEPIVLRTYSGKTDRLITAVTEILAGKEVVVPCMSGDNAQELNARKAKVQRLRASLKLLDYNAKRDFVNWGSDDYRTVAGMPGFSHHLTLSRVDPEAQAIACADIDGDGKADFCLVGASKTLLLQNGGDYFNESALPGLIGGGRSAAWADYNGDGKPDLLLTTLTGIKLYTNLGNGQFRDDSDLLPKEDCYHPTAVAWIDYDADGLPDILFANGCQGLRLYRNKGKVEAPATPIKAKDGKAPPPVPWFEDRSDLVGLGECGHGSGVKGDFITVADVNNDGYPDFLYGGGEGMLFMNTPRGFELARDSGIAFTPGKVGPVFADFDGDGHLDLFVPQKDGCKLFKNDGRGRFTDVTAQSGDLARFEGWATSAAWGDIDNDGHLDLVVGCLKSSNCYFRNKGDGTFEDATEKIGLHQRIFNTQAVCLVDVNNDGMLDMIFANEGQESCVFLGNPSLRRGRSPVIVEVGGSGGKDGCRVNVLDPKGNLVAMREVAGGGKGGQQSYQVRFALEPGAYRLVVRYSSDLVRSQAITVSSAPMRARIDEKTPLLAQSN